MTPEQFEVLKRESDASHQAVADLGNRIFILKEPGASDEVAATFARYRASTQAIKEAVEQAPQWIGE